MAKKGGSPPPPPDYAAAAREQGIADKEAAIASAMANNPNVINPGDWIKIRTDLYDDPDVFLMSELLGLDCPTVVGHLLMFWGWMDRHTSDGIGIKLTENVIDKKIGVDNFASSLRQVGWLSGENLSLELPNFERHNGASAKARALEAEAKRIRRTIEKPVGQVSDKKSSECQTREEERRVKKNNKKKVFNAPDKQEVINFFVENGYQEEKAINAFDYYAENDWKDSQDKPIKNWKQKMRGNWFREENKQKPETSSSAFKPHPSLQ